MDVIRVSGREGRPHDDIVDTAHYSVSDIEGGTQDGYADHILIYGPAR